MTSASDNRFDIVVVGGGLAGKAAAISAEKAGFATFHAAPQGKPDRRTSALMQPSVDFLLKAGLIENAQRLGTPLAQIRIIDATERFLRAPEILFDATEFGFEAFAWNFANSALAEAMAKAAEPCTALQTRDTQVQSAHRENGVWHLVLGDGSTVSAPVIVGADGKQSLTRKLAAIAARERTYNQSALVCDLELERPLGDCSVEFHYPHGPFTLVPAGGHRANLVWIDAPAPLAAAQADAQALRAALMEKSQHLFGALAPLTPAIIFPLSALSVESAGREGVVLVGESAHAFPPIGAQGLNLGLRDVADFTACLQLANTRSYGWADRLSTQYSETRAADLLRTGHFVDGLFRSLISDMLPAQALRSAGVWALKTSKPLRRLAVGLGMGRG